MIFLFFLLLLLYARFAYPISSSSISRSKSKVPRLLHDILWQHIYSLGYGVRFHFHGQIILLLVHRLEYSSRLKAILNQCESGWAAHCYMAVCSTLLSLADSFLLVESLPFHPWASNGCSYCSNCNQYLRSPLPNYGCIPCSCIYCPRRQRSCRQLYPSFLLFILEFKNLRIHYSDCINKIDLYELV